MEIHELGCRIYKQAPLSSRLPVLVYICSTVGYMWYIHHYRVNLYSGKLCFKMYSEVHINGTIKLYVLLFLCVLFLLV